MNQTELNFMQEAMYEKVDNLLMTIVNNANAQKKKQTTTKKGEDK